MPRRDDDDDRPRHRRPRNEENTNVPCPKCGARSVRSGPWPWYLGTVGAILCRAVICNECGHEYDEKKPHAHLPTRKRNLAIVINVIGLLGILLVVGGLVAWLMYAMNPR
ncbi:MAG TPA: hypothetical protein VKD90_20230 [Gemmataceae bacterium]|nr:hypothetical protein [Gemmataceae bacterium]